MEENVQGRIKSDISNRKPSEIVFLSDFRGLGTQDSIKQALSRLSRQGKVRRLAHGIYYIPKKDPVLGEIRPDAEEVVNKIAAKERVRIRPAGAYALHRLGLTTQVPTKRVYITDGNAKRFLLGKIQIRFKTTSPKKMSTMGEISSLVIQAIEELGTDQISPEIEFKLVEHLRKEDPEKLKHDLQLASAKVNDYIIKLMKRIPATHDQLAIA